MERRSSAKEAWLLQVHAPGLTGLGIWDSGLRVQL